MDLTPERHATSQHFNFALPSDENSSPLRSPRRSTRMKKNPSVTPNRFNKFFTPRPRNAQRLLKSSRRVLQDLSAARLNTRAESAPHLNLPIPGEGSRPNKKRKLSFTSIASIPSSPIKTYHEKSHEPQARVEDEVAGNEETYETDEAIDTTDEEDEDEILPPITSRPRLLPYRSTGSSAAFLSRQLGARGRITETNDSSLWQHETAHFYSTPEDSRYYHNSIQRFSSLPFCVTSFKQSPLVAVGDEDGHVRVHQTFDNNNCYKYAEILKSWRPHDNAVMDLEISDDDKLLATASGDQMSHIYDIERGISIFFFRAHTGSVKRIQFQPGSGNSVLATCSRDGNVFLWDLRSPQAPNSVLGQNFNNLDDVWDTTIQMEPVNEIYDAHTSLDKLNRAKGRRQRALPSRYDYAITTCTFIGQSRPHLLATASENDAIIKLWDARVSYADHSGRPTPVSATLEPDSHHNYRQFGVTSMGMNTDGSRLYAACRDHTVYAYSTAHLVLGGSPDMSASSTKPSKYTRTPKQGLGPLYGFRHPSLSIASFYDKLAVRPSSHNSDSFGDTAEMIAIGSGQECAVIFPTNERYLTKSAMRPPISLETAGSRTSTRASKGMRVYHDAADGLPIYQNGTALVNGHKKEVTAVAWTTNGNLVTVADDHTSRCWRQDPEKARSLRLNTDREAVRHNSGWAQVDPEFDRDDDY
ncbi:hypothetical protein LTR84_010108 [Exophiala bonariae]|uniref:Anaphase-promoting complex subunit 4 WD40 domain-containing protein n=1 Tax=Exophiala bonariae TaxID=1690606 RepID=A0AAV9NMP4_9EURO|nr:hypothetical protein LTR84_010108 [Exophiala bonariae]